MYSISPRPRASLTRGIILCTCWCNSGSESFSVRTTGYMLRYIYIYSFEISVVLASAICSRFQLNSLAWCWLCAHRGMCCALVKNKWFYWEALQWKQKLNIILFISRAKAKYIHINRVILIFIWSLNQKRRVFKKYILSTWGCKQANPRQIRVFKKKRRNSDEKSKRSHDAKKKKRECCQGWAERARSFDRRASRPIVYNGLCLSAAAQRRLFAAIGGLS